jgi:hypothetical protein
MKKRRVFFETQEVVRKTKQGYVDLDMDYFQFYNAAFSQVASLSSSCSKDFILWVMGRVTDDNGFAYSHKVYEQFNQALASIARPKTYSESTLKAAIRELTEVGIITRMSRGVYRVNPKLFWSSDVSDRVRRVKEIEQESAGPVHRKYTDEELGINPQMINENSPKRNS